ncbi:MAG: SDR family oxidoreductase [Rhodospirillaceae bacterium]|jgi:3-oxoacyl-[acyl-carrier protein] reductase|nr:SDR family oxidoreductase [Rhodospirillaceae bacterium]MBT5456043.1 SDR family oxidoreductase [Rhodospirillaceae bacterium]
MAEGFDVKAAYSVAGKVVIVTGGGTGIGKVYSQRLAEGGAKVVLADIAADESDAVAAAIREAGGEALSVPTDVTDEDAVQAMADKAADTFGGIDGLINNASLMSVLPRGDWFEIEADRWDSVMAVNLKGIFLCCRAVYPYMQKRGGGRIVNISSSRIWEGNPNRLDYTTSKAGVVGLTRALAREVGDDNIGVNAVTPGLTMSETQLASSSSNYLGGRDDGKCFKRPQVPDDLVGTVMFLLTDAAGFMTGQTLNVDGGTYMH